MCLYYDKEATVALKARFAKSGGKLTLWKVYEAYRGNLFPLCFQTTVPVAPGAVVSNRTVRRVGGDEKDSGFSRLPAINRGSHVFTRASAVWDLYSLERRVPVTCYLEDLVCAGTHGEAVFMQVTLTKRNHTNALKAATA